MLRLLKQSSPAQLYSEYYTAFPKLAAHNEKNDTITIRKDTNNVEFLFVEGRNLVTCKSDNLLPFLDESFSLFKVHQYDRFYEDDIQLMKLAENLQSWCLSAIKSLPALRMLIFDFSAKTEQSNEMEMKVDPLDHFSRADLQSAPSRVYVKLFTLAMSLLEKKLQLATDIKLKNPLKIVSHVGGTSFTPMIVNIGYDASTKSIRFLKYNHYYVGTKEQKDNEWIQRYSFTQDSLGFCIDLLNQAENVKWNHVMVYTFDEHCFAPLMRLLLERSVQNLKTLLVYLPVEQPILANVNMARTLLTTVAVQEKGITGTSSDLLSVFSLMEVVSDLFFDLDTLMELYNSIYKPSHLYTIDWTGDQKVNRNNAAAISMLSERILSRIESGELIKSKLGITLLLADLNTIAETPMNIKDDLLNQKRYADLICTTRIWLLTQEFLLDLLQSGKIDTALNRRRTFVLFAHVLCYLIPVLNERVGSTINNITDLITFLHNSQEYHAQCIRVFLESTETYKKVKKVEIEIEYRHLLEHVVDEELQQNIATQLDHVDLDATIKTENMDVRTDYMELFIDFLINYDSYWCNKIWNQIKTETDQLANHLIIDYDEKLSDIVRPLFFAMGKKRLEYMEKYELIEKSANSFHLNIDSDWVRTDANNTQAQIRVIIESKLYYQLARKFPSAWKHSDQKRLTETEYNGIVDSLKTETSKWKYKNVNTGDLHYYDNLNPFFTWDKTFPNGMLTRMLSTDDTIDRENKVWKILWSVIPRLMNANAVDNTVNMPYFHGSRKSTVGTELMGFVATTIPNNSNPAQKYSFLKLPPKLATLLLGESWWSSPLIDGLLYSIETPSVKHVTETFYPLIPLVLRNLFYCGVPDSQQTGQQEDRYITKGELDLKFIDFVLSYKFFATRENFSTDLLVQLFKCISVKSLCWYLMGIQRETTLQVIIVLCRVLMQLCIDHVDDVPSLRIALDDKNEELIKTIVQSVEKDIEEYELTQQVTFTQNVEPPKEVLRDITKLTGFDHFGNLASAIVSYIYRCRLFNDSSATFRIEFVIHILEWIDELVRIKSIKNDSEYWIGSDFSFDLYQPLMRVQQDSEKKYVLLRLYELTYKCHSLDGEPDQYPYIDTDNEIVQLNKYIKKSRVGIAPNGYRIVTDPLDEKPYLCLAWDYSAFTSKILNATNLDEVNKLNKSNVLPGPSWAITLLENAAAAWWLSVPELRAKIKVRGGVWNSAKWNDWLLNANARGLLHLVYSAVDPMSHLYERVKLFLIKVKESEKGIDSAEQRSVPYPGGDMLSEQLGIEMLMDVEKFNAMDNSFFESLILKRYTADEKFITEYYRESILKPKERQDYSGPAEARYQQQLSDNKFKAVEHNVCSRMDGYWDSTQEGSSHQMTNISYVHLPRLLTQKCNPPAPDESFTKMEDAPSVLKIKSVQERNDNLEYVSKYYTYFYECNVSMKDIVNFNTLPLLKKRLVEEIMRYFPLKYGVIYKFYVYSKYQRTINNIAIESATGKRSIFKDIDYDEFIKVKSFAKGGMTWHYEVVTAPDPHRHVATKFVLQGVYGNRMNIKELYSIFYYSLAKTNSATQFSDKTPLDSVPYNAYSSSFRYIIVSPLQEIYQTTAQKQEQVRKFLTDHADIITKSRSGGKNLLPFVFKLKTQEHRNKFNDLYLDKQQMSFKSGMYSLRLYYGYNDQQMWLLAVSRYALLWFNNAFTIPDMTLVSNWDGPISNIASIIESTGTDKFALVRIQMTLHYSCRDENVFDMSVTQQAVTNYSPHDITEQKLKVAIGVSVVRDAISDCCNLFGSMVDSVRNWKTFEQEKLSDCIFLAKLIKIYPLIEYITKSKVTMPMLFVSMKNEYVKELLVHFIQRKVIKNEEVEIPVDVYVKEMLGKKKSLTDELYDFIEETVEKQEELNSPAFYVENEVEARELVEYLHAKDKEQFDVYSARMGHEDEAETGPFRIVSMEDEGGKYLTEAKQMAKSLFEDFLTLDIQQTTLDLHTDYIRKAMLPVVMRKTLAKLRNDQYSFYTTNDVALETEITGGDDNGDTEELLSELTDDQSVFFKDPDSADAKLATLSNSERDNKKRERIKDSIRMGRTVLLILVNGALLNRDEILADHRLIMTLYDYEGELHPEITENSASKMKVKMGNKLEKEVKYREYLVKYFKRAGLEPVFSGEFHTGNSAQEKSENEAKFETGVTINYPAEKHRKLKLLPGPTFVQSFLIAASYLDKQNPVQQDFYMRYMDYPNIERNYAEQPVLTQADGTQVPLISLIHVSDAIRLFADRFENMEDIIEKYFNDYIAPNVNVNLEVRRCKLYTKTFKTLKHSSFKNPNENEFTKTIYLIQIVKKGKGVMFNYFEPLFKAV